MKVTYEHKMKVQAAKQYANQKPAGYDTRSLEQLRASWNAKKKTSK